MQQHEAASQDSIVNRFIDECLGHGLPEDFIAAHVAFMVNSMNVAVAAHGEHHWMQQEQRAALFDCAAQNFATPAATATGQSLTVQEINSSCIAPATTTTGSSRPGSSRNAAGSRGNGLGGRLVTEAAGRSRAAKPVASARPSLAARRQPPEPVRRLRVAEDSKAGNKVAALAKPRYASPQRRHTFTADGDSYEVRTATLAAASLRRLISSRVAFGATVRERPPMDLACGQKDEQTSSPTQWVQSLRQSTPSPTRRGSLSPSGSFKSPRRTLPADAAAAAANESHDDSWLRRSADLKAPSPPRQAVDLPGDGSAATASPRARSGERVSLTAASAADLVAMRRALADLSSLGNPNAKSASPAHVNVEEEKQRVRRALILSPDWSTSIGDEAAPKNSRSPQRAALLGSGEAPHVGGPPGEPSALRPRAPLPFIEASPQFTAYMQRVSAALRASETVLRLSFDEDADDTDERRISALL